MNRNSLPSFSVIIEWENARLSELDRARRMLEALSQQVGELEEQLAEPPELLVLYNPEAIKPQLIQSLIDDAFAGRRAITIKLQPTEHGTYYRQKNAGATMAKRDLVMFLDSDVVPEPDWLLNLIGAFQDPQVAIACGNTYIEPKGIYSKAFALFWFFPLRSKGTGLSGSTHFFANNVVFRRDLFLKYKFPELPYLRGQCIALAQALCRDGHTIYIHNEARVSHPPPNGMAHFVKRALCEGHDHVHRTRVMGGTAFPRGAAGRFKRSVRGAAKRIWRERKEVGLGALGALSGAGIAVGYYSLALIGEAITVLKPQLIRNRFSV